MKKITLGLGLLTLSAVATPVLADSPVFSANGFLCGKEGTTVTCKGPIPGGKDTVTGTGHDIVYLTVNTQTSGQPARYTYFSDTGCLIGYTFNASGKPVNAVARHRSGGKEVFSFEDGKYEKITEYCSTNPSAAAKPVAPAAK